MSRERGLERWCLPLLHPQGRWERSIDIRLKSMKIFLEGVAFVSLVGAFFWDFKTKIIDVNGE